MNGQIKYSIDFGNQDNYFSIDENTGAITLVKIISVEAQKTLDFLLFITATDGNNISFTHHQNWSCHLSITVLSLYYSHLSSRGQCVPICLSTGGDCCCWEFKTTFYAEHIQGHHRRRERPRNNDLKGEPSSHYYRTFYLSHSTNIQSWLSFKLYCTFNSSSKKNMNIKILQLICIEVQCKFHW